MKKYIIKFNLIVGLFYLILTLVEWCADDTNDFIHDLLRMSKEEYLRLGGNNIDYYLGYTAFALPPGDLGDFLDTLLFMIVHGLAWFIWIILLIPKTNEEPILENKFNINNTQLTIATIMSCYGLYYGIIIISFWFK